MGTRSKEVKILKRGFKKNNKDEKTLTKMNNAFDQLIGRGHKGKEQVWGCLASKKNENNEIMRLRTVQENETNYLEEIKTKEVIRPWEFKKGRKRKVGKRKWWTHGLTPIAKNFPKSWSQQNTDLKISDKPKRDKFQVIKQVPSRKSNPKIRRIQSSRSFLAT